MPRTSLSAAAGKLPEIAAVRAEDDVETIERVLIMALIFVVSLTAVSFPTVTATFRSIRVPSIVFFIGKHFGTGVILSTAFVHLLQDAFKALQNPIVNERWRIGDWAGMIVLGSLLSIFLVEYVSTAFVDRLHSYPSAPSTPTESVLSSPAASVHIDYDATEPRPSIILQSPAGSRTWIGGLPHDEVHERDVAEAGHPSSAPLPLAPPELTAEEPQRSKDRPLPSDERTPLRAGTEPYSVYDTSAGPQSYGGTSLPTAHPSDRPAQVSTLPGDTFFSGGHHRHEPRDAHSSHARKSRWQWLWGGESSSSVAVDHVPPPLPHSHSQPHPHPHRHAHPLPLHSHSHPHLHSHQSRPRIESRASSKGDNGKSKASANGDGDVRRKSGGENGNGAHHHGHAHMDMERWMSDMDGDGDVHAHARHRSVDEEYAGEAGDEEATKIGRRRQVIGILVLQLGIMIHSLVIGLTLSITTGSEFTSLVVAIVFHQLFEGLSLGIRIAGLPSSHTEHGIRHLPGHTLKPLLAITFATTTPLGIAIGLASLGGRTSKGPKLILVQGVMSAVSAGMLIYAACVEMLAGDFVMDAHLWRSSVRRQLLALVSLLAGVVGMAAIGILD